MTFHPTALNLPQYPFKISEKENRYFIFDEIRKKHLVLTPEEWVRQHFIQSLFKSQLKNNFRNCTEPSPSSI